VLEARGLVPLVDIAYQGLGDGLDEDAYGVRLLAGRLPELLVAVSCSKNFGLYRERVGAAIVVGQTPQVAQVAMGHLQTVARRMYSMPPEHGAGIVAGVFADPTLYATWAQELREMRERVLELRRRLAAALRDGHDDRFDFVAEHRGMFSLLGLPPAVGREAAHRAPRLHGAGQPHEHRGPALRGRRARRQGDPRQPRVTRAGAAAVRAA
jgi:aspartate aminotransferase